MSFPSLQLSPRSFLKGREGKTPSAFFMPNTIGKMPVPLCSAAAGKNPRRNDRLSAICIQPAELRRAQDIAPCRAASSPVRVHSY